MSNPSGASSSSIAGTITGPDGAALSSPAEIDASTPGESSRERGVTLRVVLLSLALAVFFGYVIPIVDLRMVNTFLGATHLPPGAVGALLMLLLVVNPLLRLLAKKLAFSRNELLTVYITCLFSTLVPGHGGENFFVSNIIGPFYFATRENKWFDIWREHLQPWFTPALTNTGEYNRALVEGWYVGLSGQQTIPWQAWLVPLFAWGAFIVALYTMLGCLSVMLRAQWGEHEALPFPLLRLPLEMTEDVDRADRYGMLGRFFRNPLMWCGFGIALFIQLVRGLNLYYPDVPTIPLELNTALYLTEAPWNQIEWTPLYIYPMAVGVTFLLTSEVSFSLWFFYWFIKLQYIAAYYLGFMPATLPRALGAEGKVFTSYQKIGVYLAYVAIVLWTGRHHFRHILRRALGRTPATAGERNEALSYPVAFWGFVLAFAFVLGWSVLAGVRLDIALAMWFCYLMIVIALARVVIEGGLLFVMQNWTPLGAMAQLANSGPGTWLSPANGLVPAAFIQSSVIFDLRSNIMPSFVQGLKLAHDRRINTRRLLALIAACTLIALAMSLWMNVRIGYETSGLKANIWFVDWGARLPANVTNDLINGANGASWLNAAWLGLGMLFTYGMMLARSYIPAFPLHPLGFLVSLSYPMHSFWFSILLGWLCKVSITRKFGGLDAYRKMIPAFLGLALGDVAAMLFWLIIDGWQGRTQHLFDAGLNEKLNEGLNGRGGIAMPVLNEQDKAFFEENGYVVARQVVPQETLDAVIAAIWEFLGMNPGDPDDWYRPPHVPNSMIEMYQHPAMWDARQSPRVHEAFADIYGTEKLWVGIDRVSMKPPVNPAHPKYDTDRGFYLHWDVDTSRLPVPFGVQGALYLTDTTEDMGGFQCVPGFHRGLEEWVKTQPADRDPRYPDPETLPPGMKVTPIPGRAGDLVIWNRLLAHGNGHNRSNRPRLAQYIKMAPARQDDEAARQSCIETWRERLRPGWAPGGPYGPEHEHGKTAELTPLGRKLVGLDLW